MPTYFWLLRRLINLKFMVKDEHQTQDTPGQPQEPSQPPKNSGRQRNVHHPQRDHSRHKGGRGHYSLKDNGSRQALEKSEKSKEKETGFDEEEEPGPDRSSQQKRHYRSGRQERSIIEESANDPYCE